MTDETQILNLLGEYCWNIDQADFDALGALFAAGRLVGPDGLEIASGSEAVSQFYRGSMKLHDGSPRTKHQITNSIVHVDHEAGTAVVRSSYVLHQMGDGVISTIMAGRYRDVFARGSAGWHFTERQFFVDLVGDLSEHLAFDL